ncbi:hypothetical protein MSAN_00656900 [Mycena sanguinolenta]|uniref:Uncharacterized protein n=1 Tax=Mycena sanguinolenta TaxID=230812 RepID=A0A8H7DFG1_9AGAR|nr:hypothetical protein MSAN_00656900 [Mycena sanguinolenta]
MRVPQELVYLIVDNLHDDIPSLKSCSLTARAFVGSAQTWIFNKVEILPPKSRDDQDSPCRKFYKLLTRSPHIASLVEELQIVLVGSETCFARDEDGHYLEERHGPWVMSGRTLSLVLPLLDLKRISLIENSPSEWNESGEFSLNWNQLGRSLKSSLGAVFSSPKLEEACLRGIVVDSPAQLLSLFSEAISLKELLISRVHFTQGLNPTPWPESQPWHPRLQSLLVSDLDGDDLCRHLLHPRIDLGHIRSLTIATETDEWEEKLALAAISGVTQHLALFEPQTWAWFAFKPILTSTLRSISFFSRRLHRLIPATFEACPENSALERIVFEGPIETFRAPRQYKDYYLPINAKIEAAMVHLSALKSVEIRAYTWAGVHKSHLFLEWADDVRAGLPSLVGRDLLILTEIVGADENLHYGWE